MILVLLGLTAAFDTMDNVLVARLLQLVGIFGSALDGFRSYLADRTMCVNGKCVRLCSAVIWGPTGIHFRAPAFLTVSAPPWFHPSEHSISVLCMLTEQSDLCATKEE